jgi:UDP-N-acetyl-D-mannosaminuronate dehydrogenase
VGGPCLTKDSYILFEPQFKGEIVNLDEVREISAILKARKINESMPSLVVKKFCNDLVNLKVKSKNLVLVGIAFKGNPPTNDVRNSPAIDILNEFKKREFIVEAWDAIADFKAINLSNYYKEESLLDHDQDLIVLIGNNFKGNIEKVKHLVENFSVRVIFDPYSIIEQNNMTYFFATKGISVANMTQVYQGDLQ